MNHKRLGWHSFAKSFQNPGTLHFSHSLGPKDFKKSKFGIGKRPSIWLNLDFLKSLVPKEWEKCKVPGFWKLFAKECHPSNYMSSGFSLFSVAVWYLIRINLWSTRTFYCFIRFSFLIDVEAFYSFYIVSEIPTLF